MNDRDRLIDDILNEVSANRRQSSAAGTKTTRQAVDDLVSDILVEKSLKKEAASMGKPRESAVQPQKETFVPTPPVEQKKKRGKKIDEEDPLASITPWGERHREGRRGMTAEEAGETANSGNAPRQDSVKNSQSFLQNLKRVAPTKKDKGEEVLYKKAGALPQEEATPVLAEPATLHDVHTDEWQTAMVGATRQMDDLYEPTRMVEAPEKKTVAVAENPTVAFSAYVPAKPVSGADEITGQVCLDGFEQSKPKEEPKPEQWESEFLSGRVDKVNDFKMEENSLPNLDEKPLTYEDDGDYHIPADAPAVKYDLLARRRSVTLRCVITALLGLLALLFSAVSHLDFTNGLLPENPVLLLGLYAFVILLGFVCNLRLIWGGFLSLFQGADQDSPAALSMLIALVQLVAMVVCLDTLPTSFAAMLVGAPALFGLSLNLLGKRLMFSRMYRNMELIGNNRTKYSVQPVEGKEDAFELGRGLSVGTPQVVFARKCVNLKNFIYHSYAPDLADRSGSLPTVLSPVFGAAGALCAALFVPFDSIPQAVVQILSGFCGGICVGLPITVTLAGNLPLYRFCRKLFGKKIMLSGYDAVETFKDTDVLAIDAAQLFPAGSVTLKSIKSAGRQSLDRSIMDVAGVVYMADSPLRPLFQDILQDKTNLVPQVDTLVYEEEMGLSGWVSGYRVLMGNKKLMENHGILVPDTDFAEQYNDPGLRAVYLSTQGVLSAVFLVKYSADPKMAEAVKQAVSNGMSLQIYSSDPNVTRDMVCRMFRLPAASVRIMSAVPRRLYKQQTDAELPSDAILSFEGSGEGYCRGLSAAVKLHRVIRMAAVLQTLFLLLGVVLFCACTYWFGGVSGVLVLLYQLIAAFFTAALPALLGR